MDDYRSKNDNWENAGSDPEGCQAELHPRAVEGLRLFNRGRYFEAHEELELAWREEKGTIRDLYRGILQVAVVYHHISHQNYPGAIKVASRAMSWLERFPPVCRGIQVGVLLADLERVTGEVERLGPDRLAEINPETLPALKFQLPPSR